MQWCYHIIPSNTLILFLCTGIVITDWDWAGNVWPQHILIQCPIHQWPTLITFKIFDCIAAKYCTTNQTLAIMARLLKFFFHFFPPSWPSYPFLLHHIHCHVSHARNGYHWSPWFNPSMQQFRLLDGSCPQHAMWNLPHFASHRLPFRCSHTNCPGTSFRLATHLTG